MVTVIVSPELRLRLLWLSIGYLLVATVLYLSLTSKLPIEIGGLFDYEDKLYHAVAYFILMAWFAQIYHQSNQRIIIALIFTVMGLMVEYLQSLNPARYAEFGDMIANAAGVILGFSLTLSSAKNILQRVEKIIFPVR
jgi:VanZ family protein